MCGQLQALPLYRERATDNLWIRVVPQNPFGRRIEEKNIAPHWDSNSDPLNVQPIASLYTNGNPEILPEIFFHNHPVIGRFINYERAS
jgi:hypothetical protein